ncbi:MAG: toluene tolerance protein [Pseudomonadales bacterium]
MKTLDKEQYQVLREDAEVLAADDHGDKVLKLGNGQIMKLFRRKRLFSSALIYPYGKRFADNVKQLKKLAIPTVSKLELFRIPSISRIAVVYQPLPGNSLDDLIQQNNFNENHIRQFAVFLAQLHTQGVYFRSIHLGNVINTPDDKLGLIDVSDMKIYRRALPASLSARNMHHFCRYPEHVAALFPAGEKDVFLRSYLAALNTSDDKKRQFEAAIYKQLIKYGVASS